MASLTGLAVRTSCQLRHLGPPSTWPLIFSILDQFPHVVVLGQCSQREKAGAEMLLEAESLQLVVSLPPHSTG